jgi:hypothetical protein
VLAEFVGKLGEEKLAELLAQAKFSARLAGEVGA